MQLPDAADEDAVENADEDEPADVAVDVAEDAETAKTLDVKETTSVTNAKTMSTPAELPFNLMKRNLSLEAVERVMSSPNHLSLISFIELLA